MRMGLMWSDDLVRGDEEEGGQAVVGFVAI